VKQLTLIVAALLVAAPRIMAQCTPSYTPTQTLRADYVVLVPDAAMLNAAPNAVHNATTAWAGCTGSGTSNPGMPIPLNQVPAGGSFSQLNVKYFTGYHPTTTTVCGSFNGTTISVYQYANDSNGNQFSCLSQAQHIVGHELGHWFGGNDLPSTCTSIMGQLSTSTTHDVTYADCQAVKDAIQAYSENNWHQQNCSQPCWSTCTDTGSCPEQNGGSPILFALRGQAYSLSGLNDPVLFDIDGSGSPILTGWTKTGTEVAFLVLDLNGNGRIDDGSELFGNHTRLPSEEFASNGFHALWQYDQTVAGGNLDERITATDSIFEKLRLWVDTDHDAISDFGELRTLGDESIIAIELNYTLSRREDEHGNQFAYLGQALRSVGHNAREVRIFDVYFVRQ
jgi:hypothetical protein